MTGNETGVGSIYFLIKYLILYFFYFLQWEAKKKEIGYSLCIRITYGRMIKNNIII